MSRYTHVNVPQRRVVDRRTFLAIAGTVAGCAGLGVVFGSVKANRDQTIEVFASQATQDDCVNGLLEQLSAVYANVTVTRFASDEMDSAKWASTMSDDRLWLVIGADKDDEAALLELDCYDWTAQAQACGDLLAFDLGSEALRSFPLEGEVGMLLCNKDLLDKAGVGTPSTVYDLADICVFLIQAGIEPLALEPMDASSASLNVALDASLAFWASDQSPQPEDREEAIPTLAALAVIGGRMNDGTSLAKTRGGALRAFRKGKAAMAFLASSELDALGDLGFPCYALSIPTLSADGISVFRPTRSIVCSSRLSDDACASVLSYLRQSAGDSDALAGAGAMSAFRNESGGVTFSSLPDSMTLSIMPPVMPDTGTLDSSNRQSYLERAVSLWGKKKIGSISYADEVEVEA